MKENRKRKKMAAEHKQETATTGTTIAPEPAPEQNVQVKKKQKREHAVSTINSANAISTIPANSVNQASSTSTANNPAKKTIPINPNSLDPNMAGFIFNFLNTKELAFFSNTSKYNRRLVNNFRTGEKNLSATGLSLLLPSHLRQIEIDANAQHQFLSNVLMNLSDNNIFIEHILNFIQKEESVNWEKEVIDWDAFKKLTYFFTAIKENKPQLLSEKFLYSFLKSWESGYIGGFDEEPIAFNQVNKFHLSYMDHHLLRVLMKNKHQSTLDWFYNFTVSKSKKLENSCANLDWRQYFSPIVLANTNIDFLFTCIFNQFEKFKKFYPLQMHFDRYAALCLAAFCGHAHIIEFINKALAVPCDVLLINELSENQRRNLHDFLPKLPLKSDAGYIRSGNDLIFVDVKTNEWSRFALDAKKIKYFDQIACPEANAKTLTQDIFQKIIVILGNPYEQLGKDIWVDNTIVLAEGHDITQLSEGGVNPYALAALGGQTETLNSLTKNFTSKEALAAALSSGVARYENTICAAILSHNLETVKVVCACLPPEALQAKLSVNLFRKKKKNEMFFYTAETLSQSYTIISFAVLYGTIEILQSVCEVWKKLLPENYCFEIWHSALWLASTNIDSDEKTIFLLKQMQIEGSSKLALETQTQRIGDILTAISASVSISTNRFYGTLKLILEHSKHLKVAKNAMETVIYLICARPYFGTKGDFLEKIFMLFIKKEPDIILHFEFVNTIRAKISALNNDALKDSAYKAFDIFSQICSKKILEKFESNNSSALFGRTVKPLSISTSTSTSTSTTNFAPSKSGNSS